MTDITLSTPIANAQPVRYYNFAEFYAEYAPYTEQLIKQISPNLVPSEVKKETLNKLSGAFSEGASQVYSNLPCHPRRIASVSAVVLPASVGVFLAIHSYESVNPFLLSLPLFTALASLIGLVGSGSELVPAHIKNSRIQKQIREFDKHNLRQTSAFGSQEVYQAAERNVDALFDQIKQRLPAPQV
jgi:hypothetical protein